MKYNILKNFTAEVGTERTTFLQGQVAEMEGESVNFLLSEGYIGQETTDPIPDFPPVRISDPFFRKISGFIPVAATMQKAGSTQDEHLETESLFKRWLKAVKSHYPEECTDKQAWLLASWILFAEYGNLIWDSPISGTEYRKAVMMNLVDKFQQEFIHLQNREVIE